MIRPKILITGSKGFIGKILIENLSDYFDIYGLDTRHGGDNHLRVDISNYADLDSAFSRIGSVDCIVHLAADPREDADWESVLINNIIGTRNIYECAKKHGIGKVIFASSGHVTGSCGNAHLITSHDPVRPDGDYGLSKAFGEIIARQYSDMYGMKSICLRIGWVIRDDDPTISKVAMKTWLSHRDLVELISKSILADVDFGIYYGVSKNKKRFWDISNAEKEIGYKPRDDAYALLRTPGSHMAIVHRIKTRVHKLIR
jgi:nucleoside-diphosphate-sugar epimerase